jgi:hypothetical protein
MPPQDAVIVGQRAVGSSVTHRVGGLELVHRGAAHERRITECQEKACFRLGEPGRGMGRGPRLVSGGILRRSRCVPSQI